MAEDWFIEEHYGMSREELEKDNKKFNKLPYHKNCPCIMNPVVTKNPHIISSDFYVSFHRFFFVVIHVVCISVMKGIVIEYHSYPVTREIGLN